MKIGLAVGLGLVIAATLWLATRPSLAPQARMQHLRDTGALTEPVTQPAASVIAGNPQRESDVGPRSVPLPSPALTSRDSTATTDTRERDSVPDSPVGEQIEPIKTETFYIVLRGDTLSGISHKYYGSAGKWSKIFDANRKTIRDPNKLTPGTKLIIPN